MNIHIQSVKFDADKRLIEFIEKKLSRLDRFEGRTTSAQVTLRLDNDHEQGNKITSVVMQVPGSELVAERRAHHFEEAVDQCVDALKQQIEKYKNK